MYKVKKRSGKTVDFDLERIKIAIQKAFERALIKLGYKKTR